MNWFQTLRPVQISRTATIQFQYQLFDCIGNDPPQWSLNGLGIPGFCCADHQLSHKTDISSEKADVSTFKQPMDLKMSAEVIEVVFKKWMQKSMSVRIDRPPRAARGVSRWRGCGSPHPSGSVCERLSTSLTACRLPLMRLFKARQSTPTF
jgi:hypothetical protein